MTEPMSSPGELLRQAREAQGLDIDTLAAMIKVTPSKLEALESGRYEHLPDANFTRALAMSVCRFLKIDGTAVLAGLPAAKTIPLSPNKPELNQPFKESRGVNLSFDSGSSLDLKDLLRPQWLAPILLLVASVVVYFLPESIHWPQWAHRPLADTTATVPAVSASPPDEAASSAAEPSDPSASAPIESASEPEAASSDPQAVLVPEGISAQVAAPASMAVDSAPIGLTSASSAASASPASSGNTLVLLSRDPSWVEVRDAKGNKLLARNLDAGETVKLDGDRPFKVVLGNAPSMQITYQGKAVDLASYTRNNVARFELK
ncbi:MAG: DUF4115 domain-containing protein [Burkholderiales bacterium]|nr:DUF4115 domain-containing protein [Burkholderiales bacterium]